MSVLDPATGVLTPAAWAARARTLLAGPGPADGPGWIMLMVGLDGSAGPVTSTGLATVGRVLLAAAAPRSLVGRIDCHQFVVLADGAEWTATRAGEALRRAVEDTGGVTASVGAALLPPRPQRADLAAAFWGADAALLDAKRPGRPWAPDRRAVAGTRR